MDDLQSNQVVSKWTRFLDEFAPATHLTHERMAMRACRLAVRAAGLETYGVGALLLDAGGEVLVEGHNRVHVGGFRADLHAEMVVLNELENKAGRLAEVGELTLITSLEPCPMCMTRLIFSGIGTVLHVCPDDIGGMVQRMDQLPPIFKKITRDNGQVWGLADCSQALRDAAFHIWDDSRDELDRRLAVRNNRATD